MASAGRPSGVPQVGDLFAGKYRIERELGRGGMGAVFLAMHEHLEERVALKLLHPEAAADGESIKRFLREGKAAVKIKGEHVARVHDVGLEDGVPYLVMEFLEGRDLSAILEARGPLPLVEAADYVGQACEALAEAHAKGIVHRDLKPANLFLVRKENGAPCIKVLDFGISKVAKNGNDSATGTSVIMGSPFYMSPEQLRSTRDVDLRADVWSLGVILFELLTDKLPFERESLAEVTSSILRDPPTSVREFRPDLPTSLEDVIFRCLEKDPARRFGSTVELVEALIPFGTALIRESADDAARVWGASGSRQPWSYPSGNEPVSGDSKTMRVPVAGASTKSTWAGDTTSSLAAMRGNRSKLALLVAGGTALTVILVAGGLLALYRPTHAPLESRPDPTATTPSALATAPIATIPAAPLDSTTVAPDREPPHSGPPSLDPPGTTPGPGKLAKPATPNRPPPGKPLPPTTGKKPDPKAPPTAPVTASTTVNDRHGGD